MQKVDGSSPFIRFGKALETGPFVLNGGLEWLSSARLDHASQRWTGVYFIVRETRTRKRTGRLSLTSEQGTGRRSRAWLGLVDVVVVPVLWSVGYRIAVLQFSETTSELVGVLLPLAFLLARQVWRSRTSTS